MNKAYLNNSNIPLRYKRDIKLEAPVEDLEAYVSLSSIDIINFVKNGNNLFIYSKYVGNGKTSWACKLAMKYLEYASKFSYKGECPVLFVNVAELLTLRKASIDNNPEAKNRIKRVENALMYAKLVIWDDIAVKGLSDFDKDYLYVYINARTSNLRSNIYTANITPEELSDIVGARLYSRIVNESYRYQLFGPDRRNV